MRTATNYLAHYIKSNIVLTDEDEAILVQGFDYSERMFKMQIQIALIDGQMDNNKSIEEYFETQFSKEQNPPL
jgi:hypothetical protein